MGHPGWLMIGDSTTQYVGNFLRIQERESLSASQYEWGYPELSLDGLLQGNSEFKMDEN